MQPTNLQTSNWKRIFSIIWTGQAFSLLGSGLVQFALVWWLTKTTGSPTVLATATVVALLPEIVLGPFIGALVDRWNRKRVMIFADGSVALATGLLGLLYLTGNMQIWHVYVLMFARALGGVFHWSAMQASTSLMVPDEHLSRVAGINQSLRGALGIACPPLGALLMTLLPLHNILWIDVLTAIIAIGLLLAVPIPQPDTATTTTSTSPINVLRDVRAGLRYVTSWPGLVALLIIAMLLNFIAYPALSLMPLLITDHFGGSAWHLGMMEGLWGAGIVAGGLLLGVWGGFRKKVYTMFFGLIMQGFVMLLVAAAPPDGFFMALIGMTLAGAFNALVNGPTFALLQAKVAPEMQGRVFTLVGSAIGIMSPLSLAIAGPTAEVIGVRFWYWVLAIGTILISVVAFCIPSVLHLDDSNGHAAVSVLTPSEKIGD